MSSDSSDIEIHPILGIPWQRLPRHIAIIMDGNGRWAQERGLPRLEGHRNGSKALRSTVTECARVIKKAGAKRVDVWVAARAIPTGGK